MLLAVGSCVVGNLNMFAMQTGANIGELRADVRVDEAADDSYGAITVDVQIEKKIPDETLDRLRKAAGSGRVTGRLSHNSEVHIAVSCIADVDSNDRTSDRRAREAKAEGAV